MTTYTNNEWWDYGKNVMLCNPTAGSKVLYESHEVEVIASTTNPVENICARFSDGQLVVLPSWWLKPLDYVKLTERQQAGLKLWKAMYNDNLSDEGIMSDKDFEYYCRPFDQGMLK